MTTLGSVRRAASYSVKPEELARAALEVEAIGE
jgi:hypothetical protein